MSNMPRQPASIILHEDGTMEIIGGFTEESPSERVERKKISTKCGHVKRRLRRNEPLTGKVLEFALSVADRDIADKLKAGQPLSDYELHLMLDVYLLHKRLGRLSSHSSLHERT